MKTTFNDILNRMKQAFFDECGQNVDNMGDIGARFQVVASELYSLLCNIDYIKRQSFVQTAEGEYLDYHAELRDMHRKASSKAIGILTFAISEPLDSNFTIEAGTICAVKDKPFIQFSTNEDAVILAGETSVDVAATALEAGEEYNAKIGTITVLVAAPTLVSSVTNNHSFYGGYDDESDEALRRRLIKSFEFLPTGVSIQYMEDMIRDIDEVIDCKIAFDSPNATVYVRTYNDKISVQLSYELEDRVKGLSLAWVGYEFVSSTKKSIWLTIETDGDKDIVLAKCKEYLDRYRIGKALNLMDLRIWICKETGIEINAIKSEQANGEIIVCQTGEHIYLEGVEIV